MIKFKYIQAKTNKRNLNNMSETQKNPTPDEAANTHAAFINELKPTVEDTDELNVYRKEMAAQNFLDSAFNLENTSMISFRSPEKVAAAIESVLANESSTEELRDFALSLKDVEDGEEWLGDTRYHELLEAAGIKVHLDLDPVQKIQEAAKSLDQNTSKIEEDLKNYAEEHIDALHTAALAHAALEGVQINHPNAIKISK